MKPDLAMFSHHYLLILKKFLSIYLIHVASPIADMNGEGSFSMSFSFKGKAAGKGDFDGKGDMVSDQKVAGNAYGENKFANKTDSKTSATAK